MGCDESPIESQWEKIEYKNRHGGHLVFLNEPKINRNKGNDVRKVLTKCGEDLGRIVLVML